ncbi:hypothetical protein JCM10212_001967 [Sporobolomyces blumeae]
MPAIDVFVTSILANPGVRGRHERVRRALTAARVPYAEHDVAGDEKAKSLWKRKNGGKNELPLILVDGEPVGTIEELDEAVEFGELKQFLRLDAPQAAPAAQPALATDSAAAREADDQHTETLSEGQPEKAVTTATPSPPSKPSLDDFADLDLTEAELAELAREIALGDTFSSGLGSSHDPSRQGYDFSDSTRRFEPTTAPLRFERVNFTRPLPDRPLASDVVRDELEGIDQDDLDIDELEKLAKELEAEELERRRLRDAQDVPGIEPPPVPEKQADDTEQAPPLPEKGPTTEVDEQTVDGAGLAPHPSSAIAGTTSVGGMGGASLSKPLAEIERLDLSKTSMASPGLDGPRSPETKTLVVESPVKEDPAPAPKFFDEPDRVDQAGESEERQPASKSFLSSVSDALTIPPLKSASPANARDSTSTAAGQAPERKRSTSKEIAELKQGLDEGTVLQEVEREGRTSEMPHFGVIKDMDPTAPPAAHDVDQENRRQGEPGEADMHATKGAVEGRDLDDRVADAIRDGDL